MHIIFTFFCFIHVDLSTSVKPTEVIPDLLILPLFIHVIIRLSHYTVTRVLDLVCIAIVQTSYSNCIIVTFLVLNNAQSECNLDGDVGRILRMFRDLFSNQQYGKPVGQDSENARDP